MKPLLGREARVLNGHKHTEICSDEVEYYSEIDAETVEVLPRGSF